MNEAAYQMKQVAESNPDIVLFVRYDNEYLLLCNFTFFTEDSNVLQGTDFNATILSPGFGGDDDYTFVARRGFSFDKITFCAVDTDMDIGLRE